MHFDTSCAIERSWLNDTPELRKKRDIFERECHRTTEPLFFYLFFPSFDKYGFLIIESHATRREMVPKSIDLIKEVLIVT